MKESKKVILIFIFVILLVILSIILFFSSRKNTTIKTNTTKFSYYKESYQYRYEQYKNKYPNLKEEDIITRVNIGLDYSFYTHTKETKYKNTDYVLVNKYSYLPKDYIPSDLESIDILYAKEGMQLVKSAKDAYLKMTRDAAKNGLTIRIISSYRSYIYQQTLYNNYKKIDGMKKADTYSARPGFSEHQTGLCIDIDNKKVSYENFEETEEFKWMKENAHKYGFILRYPKGKENITGYQYESWHYRYVGIKIATDIYKQDITFDEYYVKMIETKK